MDENGLSLRQIKHNPQWGVMFYSVKSEWMRTLDKNDRIPLHMDMQVSWSPWMDENGLSPPDSPVSAERLCRDSEIAQKFREIELIHARNMAHKPNQSCQFLLKIQDFL